MVLHGLTMAKNSGGKKAPAGLPALKDSTCRAKSGQ
jgi:hypothetical protein